MSREISMHSELDPKVRLEVIWLRHKEVAKDMLSLFGLSGVKGVRGTHNRNHEVAKPETPVWVKVVVTLVGHVEWRFVPCSCSHKCKL
jgi:hypothetical protein